MAQNLPLAGIKVLSFEQAVAAPLCTRHLVDLGDRYFQAGDKKKALETWARIKQVVPNRARAAPTFAAEGLYLEHVEYAERWGLPRAERAALTLPLPS